MDAATIMRAVFCTVGLIAAVALIYFRPRRYICNLEDELQLPDKGMLKYFFSKASRHGADSAVNSLYELHAAAVSNASALALLRKGKMERQLSTIFTIAPLVLLSVVCASAGTVYLIAVPVSYAAAWLIGKVMPRGEYRDSRVDHPKAQPDYDDILTMPIWIDGETRRVYDHIAIRGEIAELRRREVDASACYLGVFAVYVCFVSAVMLS